MSDGINHGQKINYCETCEWPKGVCDCSLPTDFVVIGYERKSIFRYIRKAPGNWDKMIRREWSWDFHDNVGGVSARDALNNAHDQVFIRKQ